MDIAGKKAVVIGGTSGIGLATSLTLVEKGASVIAVSRDPSKAGDVPASIELATLDSELTAERDQLSKSKRVREKMRSEGLALQGEQGFVSNDSLVQDFEQRKIALREKSAKVVQLRQKYDALMSSIDRDGMALSRMGQKS